MSTNTNITRNVVLLLISVVLSYCSSSSSTSRAVLAPGAIGVAPAPDPTPATAESTNFQRIVVTTVADSTLTVTGDCSLTTDNIVVDAGMPATITVMSETAGEVSNCVVVATPIETGTAEMYTVPTFTVAETDLVPTVTATAIEAPNSATDDRGLWVSVMSTQAGRIELLGQTCTSYSEGMEVAANTAMQIQLFDFDYTEFVPGTFTGCQVRVRTASGRIGVATVAPFTLSSSDGRAARNTSSPKIRATATVNGTSVRVTAWSTTHGDASFPAGSHCAFSNSNIRSLFLGNTAAEAEIVPARGSAFAPGLHVCRLDLARIRQPTLSVSFAFTIAAMADVYTGNAPVRWTDSGVQVYINTAGRYQLSCGSDVIGDVQTVTTAGTVAFPYSTAVDGTTYSACSIQSLMGDTSTVATTYAIPSFTAGVDSSVTYMATADGSTASKTISTADAYPFGGIVYDQAGTNSLAFTSTLQNSAIDTGLAVDDGCVVESVGDYGDD